VEGNVKYQSLMVYLDLGQPLRVACDLADRFKSRVIGATAGVPTEARAADLLIVGRREKGVGFMPNQSLDIGDVIVRAGRPMLVVPPPIMSSIRASPLIAPCGFSTGSAHVKAFRIKPDNLVFALADQLFGEGHALSREYGV
jgi:hypothetical protein